MDLIFEFVAELLFEVPFEIAMENRRIKTWIKTTLFCILGGLLSFLFGFIAVSVWLDQRNIVGTVVMALLTLGWIAFIILGAIWGHKRKWSVLCDVTKQRNLN